MHEHHALLGQIDIHKLEFVLVIIVMTYHVIRYRKQMLGIFKKSKPEASVTSEDR